LADSPMLTNDEASSILRAIAARVSTAPEVYTQGEQDRLAAAAVSVIRRKDFDVAAFEPWLAALQNEDRDVWTQTSFASLARYQNHSYLLQALTVRLSLEPASAKSAQYRREVLKVLADR
jgi:erythromycin esterase-like protein